MSPNDIGVILRQLARLEEKVDHLSEQVSSDAKRVNEIELSRATERGAALQRAATIEDERVTRASDLAKNAWVKPGAVAVLVVLLDAAIRLIAK